MVFAGGGGLVESVYDKKNISNKQTFPRKKMGKNCKKNGEVISVCPRLLNTFFMENLDVFIVLL